MLFKFEEKERLLRACKEDFTSLKNEDYIRYFALLSMAIKMTTFYCVSIASVESFLQLFMMLEDTHPM